MEAKVCTKCKTGKTSIEFPKDPRQSSGLSVWCLQCHRVRNRAYYAKNKKRLLAKSKIYAAEHSERIRDLQKTYREKNYVKISPEEWERRRIDREDRRRREVADRSDQREMVRLVSRCKPRKRPFRCPVVATISTYKQCTQCLNCKPLSEFPKRITSTDGHCSNCKKCKQQYTSIWQKQNRDRLRFLSRKRYASRPDVREQSHTYSKAAKFRRKTRLQNVRCDLTAAQWRTIKSIYKNCCAYCGKKKPLTQDHVIPISKGGAHTASNIIPACQSCNSSKGARLPLVTYQPHLIA